MRAFALSMLIAVSPMGLAAAQTTTDVYYHYTPPTVNFLFDSKTRVDVSKAYLKIMDTCVAEAQRVPVKQDLVFFTCVERVAKEEGAFFIDGSATIICGNGGSDPSKNRVCLPLSDIQRRPQP